MRVSELFDLAPRYITGFHNLELVCKTSALRSDLAFLCLVYSNAIRLTFRCILIFDGLLVYRSLDVSFKVRPESLNFTDDFVGGGLEKRVSDMISGGGMHRKSLNGSRNIYIARVRG